MDCLVRRGSRALLLLAGVGAFVPACDPERAERAEAQSPRSPRGDGRGRDKAPPCPPPPAPEHEAIVVGTIGKYHLVESRYPLARLADVMVTFKPDLVLVGARVEAVRAKALEEASFEMTYAAYLADRRSAPVEAVDWFRFEDAGIVTSLDPYDTTEIVRRETEILARPPLFTFEQANDAALGERIFLAEGANTRYRSGDPIASRRRAWMDHLAIDAVTRHGKPKRVLVYVDVFDRAHVEGALHTAGYTTTNPVALLAKSKEVAAIDLPSEMVDRYRMQLGEAKRHLVEVTHALAVAREDTERRQAEADKAERQRELEASRAGVRIADDGTARQESQARLRSAPSEKTKAFWTARIKELEVVVAQKAACCVPESAFR